MYRRWLLCSPMVIAAPTAVRRDGHWMGGRVWNPHTSEGRAIRHKAGPRAQEFQAEKPICRQGGSAASESDETGVGEALS